MSENSTWQEALEERWGEKEGGELEEEEKWQFQAEKHSFQALFTLSFEV